MVTSRTHRMTELFGRLAPGATVETARAELTAVHAAMMREHPEAYSSQADVRLSVRPLRDQIASPARTILLVLLASAAIVFVIACSNAANLILARSVRREGELAVRAALGASHGALRRTLLAESLVLCGAGAVLGLLLARPFVAVVARYAARFSVRALEVTVDASLLWVGAGARDRRGRAVRVHPTTAVTARADGPRPGERQHPDDSWHQPSSTDLRDNTDCVLVRVARRRGDLAARQLVSLQTATTGYNMRQVLALDVPSPSMSIKDAQEMAMYQEMTRRIGELPGVQGVALGSVVPWRDAGRLRPTSSSPSRATRRRMARKAARAVAHRRPALLRGARDPDARRARFHRR